ncbi:MAG: DHH family phosphoesterase [Oscillospiraceae bacterium]|nr:DHH family phosphoesterase [Oscillospiraceae bacterium]
MKTLLTETARQLREKDNILILTHAHPDGDTLGGAYALCRALLSLQKKADVLCEDEIPKAYRFMAQGLGPVSFEPEYIVAVDVASQKLLGESVEARFGGRVDLCIDHHLSGDFKAETVLNDDTASSAAEVVFSLLKEMKIDITPIISECIYAGLSTDTGCFRYANVTSASFRAAAELIDLGADFARLNRELFETKSKSFAALERMALNSVETHCDGLFALIAVTQAMLEESGSRGDDFDRISALPRQLEDVLVGATLREQTDGTFKASVRTNPPVSAADICKKMNGGGHFSAAGCTLGGPLDAARDTLLTHVKNALETL